MTRIYRYGDRWAGYTSLTLKPNHQSIEDISLISDGFPIYIKTTIRYIIKNLLDRLEDFIITELTCDAPISKLIGKNVIFDKNLEVLTFTATGIEYFDGMDVDLIIWSNSRKLKENCDYLLGLDRKINVRSLGISDLEYIPYSRGIG